MPDPEDRPPPHRSLGGEVWFVLTRRKRYWMVPIAIVVGFLAALILLTDYRATPPFVYRVF